MARQATAWITVRWAAIAMAFLCGLAWGWWGDLEGLDGPWMWVLLPLALGVMPLMVYLICSVQVAVHGLRTRIVAPDWRGNIMRPDNPLQFFHFFQWVLAGSAAGGILQWCLINVGAGRLLSGNFGEIPLYMPAGWTCGAMGIFLGCRWCARAFSPKQA